MLQAVLRAGPTLQPRHSLGERIYTPSDDQQIRLLFFGASIHAHKASLTIKLLNFRGIYQLQYIGAPQKPRPPATK